MPGLGFYMDPHVAHVGTEAGKNTEHTMFHRDDFAALAEEYSQMCMGEATMSMEQFVAKHKTRTQGRLSVSDSTPRRGSHCVDTLPPVLHGDRDGRVLSQTGTGRVRTPTDRPEAGVSG